MVYADQPSLAIMWRDGRFHGCLDEKLVDGTDLTGNWKRTATF